MIEFIVRHNNIISLVGNIITVNQNQTLEN
jgi:hypothetical protein